VNGPAGASLPRRALLRGLSAGGLGWLGLGSARAAESLERIRQRGSLSVAVYEEMPPFNVKGQGLDVALAQALAERLGLKLRLLPFPADDKMDDDLRNMVWKGHYLGYGPADVLLHVPVDRPLMVANPQVSIFAPYYRERVMIARDLRRVPVMDSLKVFAGQPIAVPGQSLAGWLMLGADDGAYRDQLITRLADGAEAARALQRGECVAAAGLASELESVLGRDSRYAIEALPSPRAPRDGWVVGCAVKREAADLADAIRAAIEGMATDGQLAGLFQQASVVWRRP
jgi:ABC-type amino acid transport substrate-binding protein